MRVLSATSIHVGSEEHTRRQERYHRISPAVMEVTLVDPPHNAQQALNSDEAFHLSNQIVAQVMQETREGFNLVIPDYVLDPAFAPSNEDADMRGLLHQAALSITESGEPLGVIVRNKAIAKELRRRLEEYGLNEKLVDVHVMDLLFEAVAKHEMWTAAMTKAVQELGDQSARTVINGCSTTDVDEEGIGVRGIDPTQEAMKQIAAAAR